LQVYKEARDVASKQFNVFSMRKLNHPISIYINWEADTLIYPSSDVLVGFFISVKISKDSLNWPAEGLSRLQTHLRSIVFRAEKPSSLWLVRHTVCNFQPTTSPSPSSALASLAEPAYS